jgi:glycine cleavage system aminomethyltransferase T
LQKRPWPPGSAAHPSALELKMHRGAQTPLRFSGTSLQALLHAAGIFDLGYRTFLRATGKDRVRWLNGMITQAVKSMAPGQTGYTLILNPQGRIQGDGDVSALRIPCCSKPTAASPNVSFAHLRRYIIMDDVKLEELDGSTTAIGIAGPGAAAILRKLGFTLPEAGTFRSGQLAGAEVTLVHAWSPVVTRFEIHVPAGQVLEACGSSGWGCGHSMRRRGSGGSPHPRRNAPF